MIGLLTTYSTGSSTYIIIINYGLDITTGALPSVMTVTSASTAADQLPQLCVCPLVCFSRQYRPDRPLTLLGRPRIDHIDPAGRHSRVPEDVEINTTTVYRYHRYYRTPCKLGRTRAGYWSI